jgi:hypothetical protein
VILASTTDIGKKLQMIETPRWMESIFNIDSEPNASITPLPQSLLDELDIVWRDRDSLDRDDNFRYEYLLTIRTLLKII